MNNHREHLEELEMQTLASFAMHSKDSRGRRYDEPQDEYRTCYQRDRDRIIHSPAFRRLEYKTQVFVNHEGDYYRTRLTHTIEVNQLARTVARTMRLNEDLVDAISLAHDIGHTPFGHAGEEVLNELMKQNGGFEHNRQGLKVVDEFGGRYPDFKGINLTFETREGIIKHTSLYDKVQEVKEFYPGLAPTLETQVVNVVDEIAYNSHDLDDGLKSGYISIKQLEKVKLWSNIYNSVGIEDERLRKYKTIRELINTQIKDVIGNTEKQIEKHNIKTVEDVRQHKIPIMKFSSGHQILQKELQDFLYENLYKHKNTVSLNEKAKVYITELFNAYIKGVRQLPVYFGELAQKDKYSAVCDYIAGMTDRFAQQEYERLVSKM
ncbi:MAG: deoxyguanosinetriphosphate triphosphohydrolase [bacterium]|nr:deoxyguanosinetriphosphate triphosphohydrolase [bacterium]